MPQIERFLESRDRGGVVFCQTMAQAAQTDGNCFLPRIGVLFLPMRLAPSSVGQHLGGLTTPVIPESRVICPPACVIKIIRGDGFFFSLLVERQLLIPPPRKV